MKSYFFNLIKRKMHNPIININGIAGRNIIHRYIVIGIAKIKPIILHILIISFLFNSVSPLYVYADELSSLDGSFTENLTTYKDWTLVEKADATCEILYTYMITHLPSGLTGGVTSDRLYSMATKRWAELKTATDFNPNNDPVTGDFSSYMASLWDYDDSTDTVTVTPEGQNLIYNTVNNSEYINNDYSSDSSDDDRYGYTMSVDELADFQNVSDTHREALRVVAEFCESNGYVLRVNGGYFNDGLCVHKYSPNYYVLNSVSVSDDTLAVYPRISNSDSDIDYPFDVIFYHYNSVSEKYELYSYGDYYAHNNINSNFSYRLYGSLDNHFYSWQFIITPTTKQYRVYDSINEIGSGNVPWKSYYSVGDTITNFSEVHNFTTNHNEEYNTWITNYYDDNNDMPSLPDIIVYIRTIVPEPTPNPNPSPTPKPTTNTSTSDGVTVTQNANPIVNVYNNITVKISDLISSILGIDTDTNIDNGTDNGTDNTDNNTDNPSDNPSVSPAPTPSGGDQGESDDTTNTEQCICTDKCDKDNINSDCPVCSKNYKNCKGKSKSLFDRLKDSVGNLFSGIADFLTDVIMDAIDSIVKLIVGEKVTDAEGNTSYEGGILGAIRSVLNGVKSLFDNDITNFFRDTIGAIVPVEVWNMISLILALIALMMIVSIFKR